MVDDLVTRFFVRAVAAPVSAVPRSLVPYAPAITALLEMAEQPLCGATTDDLETQLRVLAARKPIHRNPQPDAPQTLHVLLTDAHAPFHETWIANLCPGALVITCGSHTPPDHASIDLHVVLDVEAGLSLSLVSGGNGGAVRDFLTALAGNENLRNQVSQVLRALQRHTAYQNLAADGVEQRNARIVQYDTRIAQYEDQLNDISAQLSESQAKLARLTSGASAARKSLVSLSTSSTWFRVLRHFSGARRRVNSARKSLEKAFAHIESMEPASQTNFIFEPTSQSSLLEMVPRIAGWFTQYGMRPGGWVEPEILKKMQAHDLTLVAKSFYSVCPDVAEMGPEDWSPDKYAEAWACVPKTDFADLLPAVSRAAKALQNHPIEDPQTPGVFFWQNEMFSPRDAISYHAIIDHVAPKQILEVGSGNSTAIALEATTDRPTKVRCIEPYPSPFLKALKPRLEGLIQKKVEDVDPEIFRELDAQDILFIDSSHCARMSSDLNFLMFEALPRLKAGVIVHFHDIFLPNEYPEAWLRDVGIMWNEQYQLLAFLMNNKDYELIWSSSHAPAALPRVFFDAVREGLPDTHPIFANEGPYGGGSIWLRKLR